MSIISCKQRVIQHYQTNSISSLAKVHPATTTSSDSIVKPEDDKLTSSALTTVATTAATPSEDKNTVIQTNTMLPFNVLAVVYEKPCKRPKSILKVGNKNQAT